MQLIAVADDLSGATETLAALGMWGARVWLNINSPKALLNELHSGANLVIDSNSRHLNESAAKLQSKQIQNLLLNTQNDALIFRKVDSLLRGNVAVAVAAAAINGPVILALANPKTGRTILGGKVLVNGQPLELTELWRLESSQPWSTVAEAILPIPSALLKLDDVRAGQNKLSETLNSMLKTNQIIVCDAETEQDLDSLVQCTEKITNVQFVGTAGLARAISRRAKISSNIGAVSVDAVQDISVIVGSSDNASLKQVEVLALNRWQSFNLSDKLPSQKDLKATALVLTGGETARRILDQIKTDWIQPFHEIENGVICSRSSNGQVVVTKPGSYGDENTLLRALNFLKTKNKNEMSGN